MRARYAEHLLTDRARWRDYANQAAPVGPFSHGSRSKAAAATQRQASPLAGVLLLRARWTDDRCIAVALRQVTRAKGLGDTAGRAPRRRERK